MYALVKTEGSLGRCCAISVIFTMLTFSISAQGIQGSVVDVKTIEPLPFANVYLNNTTIGTVSNASGEFELKNIPVGSYELIISFIGYESFKQPIVCEGNNLRLDTIRMSPAKIELANINVTATRDKSWEKQLKKFEK